jgi:hypothetical protein
VITPSPSNRPAPMSAKLEYIWTTKEFCNILEKY